jgi:hypothetical protein
LDETAHFLGTVAVVSVQYRENLRAFELFLGVNQQEDALEDFQRVLDPGEEFLEVQVPTGLQNGDDFVIFFEFVSDDGLKGL